MVINWEPLEYNTIDCNLYFEFFTNDGSDFDFNRKENLFLSILCRYLSIRLMRVSFYNLF